MQWNHGEIMSFHSLGQPGTKFATKRKKMLEDSATILVLPLCLKL